MEYLAIEHTMASSDAVIEDHARLMLKKAAHVRDRLNKFFLFNCIELKFPLLGHEDKHAHDPSIQAGIR